MMDARIKSGHDGLEWIAPQKTRGRGRSFPSNRSL